MRDRGVEVLEFVTMLGEVVDDPIGRAWFWTGRSRTARRAWPEARNPRLTHSLPADKLAGFLIGGVAIRPTCPPTSAARSWRHWRRPSTGSGWCCHAS